MKKRSFILLFATIGFFAIAWYFDYQIKHSDSLATYTAKINQYFLEQEEGVYQWLNNPDQLRTLFTPASEGNLLEMAEKASELERLSLESYSLFWYKKPKLVFWSKNDVIPSNEALSLLQSKQSSTLFKLANAQYYLSLHQVNKEEYIVSAIPIKRTYQIESDHLKNNFILKSHVPNNIFLTEVPTPYPLINKAGETIGYFGSDGTVVNSYYQRRALLFYIISFILLGILVNKIANYLVINFKAWVGAGFLLLSVLGMRLLSQAAVIREKFSELEFIVTSFDIPVLYGSLGDWIVNSVLFLWLMIFFHREFKVHPIGEVGQGPRFLMTGLNYFPIIIGLLLVTNLFKSLVADSGIQFDFNSVFQLDIYSFLAIISLILLLIALFLFTHRMMKTIRSIGLPKYHRMAAFALGVIGAVPFMLSADLLFSPVQMILITVIYVQLFDIFVDNKLPAVTWMVIWLFMFSAYSAILLFKYNIDRDVQTRMTYAREIADNRDKLANQALEQFTLQLSQDTTLHKLLTLPIPFQREYKMVRDQIDSYFRNNSFLLKNFFYEVYAYNESYKQIIIKGQSLEEVEQIIDQQSSYAATATPNLYIFSGKDSRFDYFINFELTTPGNETVKNQVFVGLQKKNPDASKVYRELLQDVQTGNELNLDQYDLMIFKGDSLVEKRGKIEPNVLVEVDLPEEGEFKKLLSSSRSELIYKGKEDTLVVLGKSLGGYTKILSLFSYLFVLIIGIILLLAFLNNIIHALPEAVEIPFVSKSSLRNRIQLSVILLTLGSFILIGVVTVTFFRRSTSNYHESRLDRKVGAVVKNMEYEVEGYSGNRRRLYNKLSQLAAPMSAIHKMDVNIYDPTGKLISSSEEYVFQKGIISDRMDMTAYQGLHILNNKQIIQEERIGNLSYRSAYAPLYDSQKRLLAYIGLPYYSKDRNLRSDVFDFMGTLLNAYVFLLLMAGALAIFVANSITSPLTTLGETLKGFKLGENEPLEWERQDELGALIAEYNGMLKKLEESTEKLKVSEREGAWREMAKQVAHEIKNPLTPMKLSIQYLMRAYQSNPENIEPLLKRVSQTLIEQIDVLSKIASEFSNFAKMPKAENQHLHLNELIQSVYSLYSKQQNEDLQIRLDLPDHSFWVFGDKGHLIRVFTNLIKNSIQAIPDGRKGNIKISLYQKGPKVVVKVSDNGKGISREMQEKVFFPNFTTKTSGMGLGLAISKNVIEAIEGKIYFETIVNKGTDFFVELPITEIENSELKTQNSEFII